MVLQKSVYILIYIIYNENEIEKSIVPDVQ